MIIVHHLGQSSQDSENLSRRQIARGKSPSESLGALDMNSSNESCMIRHLLVVWQHNATDSDTSLQSRGMAWLLSIIWGNPVKIQKAKIAWGKSPPESLGALDMNSSNESCMIRHLLVAWRYHATDSDNSLSIGSHQAPPQVPSPTETGTIRIVRTVQAVLSTRYQGKVSRRT